jgi:hypothetical protein
MDFPLPLTFVLMMEDAAQSSSDERTQGEASPASTEVVHAASGVFPNGMLLGRPSTSRVRAERVA